MRKVFILLSLLQFGFVLSCSDDDAGVKKYSINGVAQKGPFINGSTVELLSLNNDLSQTGETYRTEIVNDLGQFELSDFALRSSFVEIIANGYYYDEVSGSLSQSTLTLKSLSDISDKSSINVNILTHITYDRIKHLIKSGLDFKTAKETAEKEALAIFKIADPLQDFESLDMALNENKNGVLITVSSIFQGRNSVAELTKLLADFKNDFAQDGTIDNVNVLVDLFSNATQIEPSALRKNLEDRYKSVGAAVTVPGFSNYLDSFIEGYSNSGLTVSYPGAGIYGDNLLSMKEGSAIQENVEYSIAAEFPSAINMLLRFKIGTSEGISISVNEEKKTIWSGLPANGVEISATALNKRADLSIVFTGKGTVTLQVYEYKIDTGEKYLGARILTLAVE